MDKSELLKDIINWIGDHIVPIMLFLGLFIEIIPIKISPISALVKLIFKPIRKDLDDMKIEINKNIDNVRTELKEEISIIKRDQEKEQESIEQLIYANEMIEVSRIWWEIVEFSSSIKNGQLHSRDEYRHIKDDSRKFKGLNEKYGLTDDLLTDELEIINKHYEKHKNSSSLYF